MTRNLGMCGISAGTGCPGIRRARRPEAISQIATAPSSSAAARNRPSGLRLNTSGRACVCGGPRRMGGSDNGKRPTRIPSPVERANRFPSGLHWKSRAAPALNARAWLRSAGTA